jgi:hypothetical protein
VNSDKQIKTSTRSHQTKGTCKRYLNLKATIQHINPKLSRYVPIRNKYHVSEKTLNTKSNKSDSPKSFLTTTKHLKKAQSIFYLRNAGLQFHFGLRPELTDLGNDHTSKKIMKHRTR